MTSLLGSLRVLFGAFLISTASVSAAQATTYGCTEAKDKALLGYSGGGTVSPNHGNKICRWSIGGASIDGKRVAAFQKAINAFLAGDLDNLSRSSPRISDFQALLLVPHVGVDIPSHISRAFDNKATWWLNDIGDCIAKFRVHGEVEVQRDGLICHSMEGSTTRTVTRQFGALEVEATQALLHIGLNLEGEHFHIFIPRSLVERGKADFRY